MWGTGRGPWARCCGDVGGLPNSRRGGGHPGTLAREGGAGRGAGECQCADSRECEGNVRAWTVRAAPALDAPPPADERPTRTQPRSSHPVVRGPPVEGARGRVEENGLARLSPFLGRSHPSAGYTGCAGASLSAQQRCGGASEHLSAAEEGGIGIEALWAGFGGRAWALLELAPFR